MKNIITASLRAATVASALLVVSAIASAKDTAPADVVAQRLAVSGAVPVSAAGRYVEIGSYRIHVSAHLGRPSAVLGDGTWLYRNFTADESVAQGTLVVRFDHGRVSQLSLVSPTVETAMLTPAAKGRTLIASK